jgi:hypothetical protein
MAAWGDVCVYRNLCFDGEIFLYIDENGSPNVRSGEIIPGFGDNVSGARKEGIVHGYDLFCLATVLSLWCDCAVGTSSKVWYYHGMTQVSL